MVPNESMKELNNILNITGQSMEEICQRVTAARNVAAETNNQIETSFDMHMVDNITNLLNWMNTMQIIKEISQGDNKTKNGTIQMNLARERIDEGIEQGMEDVIDKMNTLVNGINMMKIMEEINKRKNNAVQTDLEEGQINEGEDEEAESMIDKMNSLVSGVNMMQMFVDKFMVDSEGNKREDENTMEHENNEDN